ncbi:MAG: FAD-dependent oxidoreductase [bacterium]
MKSISYWLDYPYKARLALSGSIEADVVIVGAGITGVSAAYHCAKQGLKTVLIEKNTVASGAAGKNGGMVVEGFSVPFVVAIEQMGFDVAKNNWKKTVEARTYVQSLIEDHAIDCDFEQPGSLLMSYDQKEKEFLRVEADMRYRAGFKVELIEHGQQLKDGPFDLELFTPGDCTMHPVKFVRGLARAAEEYGAIIYEETPGLHIDAHTVTTTNGIVRAKRVVLALEGSSQFADSDNVTITHEQAIVTEPLSAEDMAALDWSTGGMFWTLGEDYYNIRKIDSRLFTSGRIDPNFTEEELAAHRDFLVDIIRQRLPSLKHRNISISHHWTAVTVKSSQEQAMIRNRDGIYEIFGNGDFGFTNGMMAGKCIAESFWLLHFR